MRIKTQWELEKLYYTSLKDPRIERDLKRGDRAIDTFARKYSKNKKHLNSPRALKKALEEYEALDTLCSASPLYYPNYRKELNASDKESEALLNKLSDHYTKNYNKQMFFTLELGKIPAAIQKRMLTAKELKEFNYWLSKLFENAKHNLSEPEEKVLSLLRDVSFGRWVQAVENILNTKKIVFKGKTMPLNSAMVKIPTLPLRDRRALHVIVMRALKDASPMAESELNAIVARKKITDELRGFKEPYDATILGYENDKKSVLALVEAVNTHFSIARRFYTTKAKMMGLKELTYADRSAPVGKVQKKISFSEAAKMVRDTYYDLHPRYAEIFERLLSNGQVDVYPRAGKTSGAYCASNVDQPTMLLLNHVEDARSLLTLAHEMGHAMHSERSKTQRPLYQGYTTSVAEVASTFFEAAAFDALTKTLPPEERVVALHDKLQEDIATIFRQIAFFNFEIDLHKGVRERGLLPKEEIAALLNTHTQAYLGKAVKLTEDDGYFFVTVSHFRRFFYVYSYAFGQLVSRALFERVKKNPRFIDKVDLFLTAGCSMSPEDIFAQCDLDLRRPATFIEGLKSIEREVSSLEKAVAKRRSVR